MKSIRVLYVEDNPLDADLTRSHFAYEAPEFEIEVVGSGGECLEALQKQAYDVLLLDYRLPDMDGLDVLKNLRNAECVLPVVIITGVGDEELVVRALRAGAWSYITKSADYLATLPPTLNQVIAEFRLKQKTGKAVKPTERKILYIEHSPIDSDLTLQYFAREVPHFTVEVVTKASQALQRLAQAHNFDAVLTSLHTPDMNGLELLREAKNGGIGLPFVIVTASGDEETAAAALRLGAYDYIVKHEQYLLKLPYAIENAIARHQLEERTAELAEANANLKAEILERRRVEEELRTYQEHLEELVEARTAELAVALEQTEEADRLKSAFMAAMSHELRTPLNSILGFVGIILQGLAGPLTPEQKKQLTMVYDSARHLLALINDVLDISKIEAGQLELASEPVDMPQVIAKVVKTVTPLAEKKGLSLVAEVAPEVDQITSDQRRVEQILINLVNNAIKFTERGQVRVECRVSDERLVMQVRDTGIGIKPEDIVKLFKPFRQLDTGLTRQHEGTGLGLSICKRLVTMLGGEIWVESEWGVGSTFTFTLALQGETHERQDTRH